MWRFLEEALGRPEKGQEGLGHIVISIFLLAIGTIHHNFQHFAAISEKFDPLDNE